MLSIFLLPLSTSSVVVVDLTIEGIAVLLRLEGIRLLWLLLLLRLLETRLLRWLGLLVIVPVRLPSRLVLFRWNGAIDYPYFS